MVFLRLRSAATYMNPINYFPIHGLSLKKVLIPLALALELSLSLSPNQLFFQSWFNSMLFGTLLHLKRMCVALAASKLWLGFAEKEADARTTT